jgi:integrase
VVPWPPDAAELPGVTVAGLLPHLLLALVAAVASGLRRCPLADAALLGAAIPATPLQAWSAWHDHLAACKHRRRETLRLYRFVLFDFWQFIRPVRWDRATTAHLDRYLDRRTRTAGGRPRPLSQATRRTYAKAVRNFYAFAHVQGWTKQDRMAGYDLPPEPAPAGPSLDADELARLFARVDDERTRVMCWLAFGQLFRVGEIARALVADVDLSRGEERIWVHGKGGREGWMELNPAVAGVLRGWIAAQGRRTGPLVASRSCSGAPISPDRVSRLLSEAVGEVQAGATAHALRRASARALRRAGVDVDTIARAGRWASRDVLVRYYLDGLRDDVRRALAAIPDPTRPNGGTSPPPAGR